MQALKYKPSVLEELHWTLYMLGVHKVMHNYANEHVMESIIYMFISMLCKRQTHSC